MSCLFTLMTGQGTRLTRPLKWLGADRSATRSGSLRMLWPFRWSRRTVILLVMQTLDNAMRLRPKRRLLGRGVRLQTEQDPERPNPTFIPAADAGGALVRQADRRHRPERRSPSRSSTSRPPPTSSAAR